MKLILIDNQLVASQTRFLPPERRGVGMVFQDYALFPHLDAWQNVCFGLRKGQDKTRAIYLLELLGLVVLGQWSWQNLKTSDKRNAVIERVQNLRKEYLG